MRIRAAGIPDIAALMGIWNPVIRDTLITFTSIEKIPADLSEMIASKAQQGVPFLVIEQQGVVSGFATYGPFRTGSGYAQTMEHSIMLTDSAKGKGAGRALLTALEEHARAQDIHSLIAGISSENPAAIAFHQACGFRKQATLPEVGYKFDRWLDLILLQKNL